MNALFKNLTDNAKIILSYLSFFAAIGFGIAGLCIPPIGLIHSTVLILIALLLVLCATFCGLSVKFDLERKYFHTQYQEKEKDIDKIRRAMEQDLSQSDIEEEAEP